MEQTVQKEKEMTDGIGKRREEFETKAREYWKTKSTVSKEGVQLKDGVKGTFETMPLAVRGRTNLELPDSALYNLVDQMVIQEKTRKFNRNKDGKIEIRTQLSLEFMEDTETNELIIALWEDVSVQDKRLNKERKK